MVQPDRNRYLASIAGELTAQATRVRDLIGDSHWLSDGHHKEYLVKHTVGRHLPTGVTVSRGFVAHPRRADLVSREQDLLFINTMAEAPLFDQGGLAVVFPHTVLGALAVKTKLRKSDLEDACSTLQSVRRVAALAGVENPPWCGVLFFESDGSSFSRLANLCENVGRTVADFEASAEPLPNGARSSPDVIGVVGFAGFLVDAAEASSTRVRIRGFAGDGSLVVLNSLLRELAVARGATSAEFEAFVGGAEMTSLPGSPYAGSTPKVAARSRSGPQKKKPRSRR